MLPPSTLNREFCGQHLMTVAKKSQSFVEGGKWGSLESSISTPATLIGLLHLQILPSFTNGTIVKTIQEILFLPLLLLGIFDDILDLLGVVVQLHLTFHVKILKLDKFSSMEIINEIISHTFMINEFWLNTFGLEIVNRHHLLVATITTKFSIKQYSITVHFLYPPSCKTTDADTL